MILIPDSIELVIFDCDGVLIDSEVVSARVMVEMLEPEGVKIDQSYVYKHFLGRQFPRVKQTVFEEFSVDLPDSFESDYRQQLLSAFGQELQATSGVKEVLSNLNVLNCVATSSSPKRTQKALELVGLADHFGENIFTASEVKCGKPAPDLFQRASKKMQIDPKNCLVIEDSIMGVKAAISAGMRVWRYSGASHLGFDKSKLLDQFSQVPVFNDWQKFYQMAPNLLKQKTTVGDQRDD